MCSCRLFKWCTTPVARKSDVSAETTDALADIPFISDLRPHMQEAWIWSDSVWFRVLFPWTLSCHRAALSHLRGTPLADVFSQLAHSLCPRLLFYCLLSSKITSLGQVGVLLSVALSRSLQRLLWFTHRLFSTSSWQLSWLSAGGRPRITSCQYPLCFSVNLRALLGYRALKVTALTCRPRFQRC